MKHFLYIAIFISLKAFTQTYEVKEVSMSGSMLPIKELNTPGSEFAPYIVQNKIYFTSNREFDKFNLGENNWTKAGYLNIFSAEVKEENFSSESKFKEVELVSEKLKSNSHTGPVCFSISGDTIFFTQVVITGKKSKKNKYRPQLFMAIKNGSQWDNIQSLPFNDPTFSFGHPNYDSRKQRLYFSSDKEGGKGGKDIYYVDLVNGNWSTPVNLAEVNSEGNELFPFFIEDHLFFASDKAGGKGGLDIYWKQLGKSMETSETVSGLNSEFDEFGIFILPGMKQGYISSNKTGHDDIYFLNIEKKITVQNEMAGQFTYRNLNGTANNLKVQIFDENGDFVLETTTDENGEFIFRNLGIQGSYVIKPISEEDLNLVIYDANGNPVLDLINDEEGYFTYKKLEYAQSGIPGLIPENMTENGQLYGHLSGQLIFENKPGQYPANTKIILYDSLGNEAFTVFTDERGNFDFKHLSLSENYILKVDGETEDIVLLIFDQYGNVVAQLKSDKTGQFIYRKLNGVNHSGLALIEEQEEIFEFDSQTISGSFEFKQLNGKSPQGLTIYAYNEEGELLMTTITDENGQFRFRSLPLGNNILFKVDESDPNFNADDYTLFIYDRNGKKIAGLSKGQNGFFIYKPLGFSDNNLATVQEDSLDLNLTLHSDYKLVKVYFDSNKANVKSSDLSQLNTLYKILISKPELKMEINAYADAKASDDYNLILSQKRGDWIVDYMVKKGIDRSRFIVNAYGETQLVDSSNDALNRRAEIRIY